jgi:hypothetical protein
MLLTRQWKHAKMLKWAGRFLLPGGAEATAPGELAVACRLCPIEGINLPDNWESWPPVLQLVVCW